MFDWDCNDMFNIWVPFMTRKHSLNKHPFDNFVFSIHLKLMFLDCGRTIVAAPQTWITTTDMAK